MNLNETTILKLDKYLNQEMNSQEKEAFEAEIKNSYELKEFIEIHHQIDDFEAEENWPLYNGDAEQLKEASKLFLASDVQEFSKKTKAFLDSNQKTNIQKKSNWLRFAVGSGLAACLAFLLFTTLFQSSSLNEIYLDNNSWNELPSLTIKGDSEEIDPSNIELLFSEKKYQETITLCNKVLQNSETIQPNLLLYVGVSQLELSQYQDALSTFSILEKSDVIDFHKAFWYKSLVYLKQENKEKAIIELQKIKANSTYYNHREAKKILREIE